MPRREKEDAAATDLSVGPRDSPAVTDWQGACFSQYSTLSPGLSPAKSVTFRAGYLPEQLDYRMSISVTRLSGRLNDVQCKL